MKFSFIAINKVQNTNILYKNNKIYYRGQVQFYNHDLGKILKVVIRKNFQVL